MVAVIVASIALLTMMPETRRVIHFEIWKFEHRATLARARAPQYVRLYDARADLPAVDAGYVLMDAAFGAPCADTRDGDPAVVRTEASDIVVSILPSTVAGQANADPRAPAATLDAVQRELRSAAVSIPSWREVVSMDPDDYQARLQLLELRMSFPLLEHGSLLIGGDVAITLAHLGGAAGALSDGRHKVQAAVWSKSGPATVQLYLAVPDGTTVDQIADLLARTEPGADPGTEAEAIGRLSPCDQ